MIGCRGVGRVFVFFLAFLLSFVFVFCFVLFCFVLGVLVAADRPWCQGIIGSCVSYSKLQALATSATSRRRTCCRRVHGGARIISRATCVFLLRRLNTCCLLTYEQPWGLLPYSKNRHAKLITSRLKRYHKRYHRPDSYHTLQLSFSECY